MAYLNFKHKKANIEVSESGRMAGVFEGGKCLASFHCDDFDECVRKGEPTPQVQAERFLKRYNPAPAPKLPAEPKNDPLPPKK